MRAWGHYHPGVYQSTIERSSPYAISIYEVKKPFSDFSEYLDYIDDEYTISNSLEYDIYKEPNPVSYTHLDVYKRQVINFVVVFVLSASFIAYAPDYIKKINEFSSDISTASLDLGTKIMLPNSDSEGKDSVDLIRDSLFSIQVEQPWLLLQFGNSNAEEIGADRVEALVSVSPEDEDGRCV